MACFQVLSAIIILKYFISQHNLFFAQRVYQAVVMTSEQQPNIQSQTFMQTTYTFSYFNKEAKY